MTRKWAPIAAVLLVAAGACTTEPTESPGSTDPAVEEDVGRLVVLDGEGNIVTMNADGSDPIEITDDGGLVTYFQPVWSPLSRVIAWGQQGAEGFAVGLQREDRSAPVTVPLEGFPFYLNWSPDEMRIGALHNGADVGSIDFVVVDVAAAEAGVVDSGSPYYFSWSPEGDALVVHVDGDRLQILDESANPDDIGTVTANFLAPQWTQNGIFYVGRDGVVLRQEDGTDVDVLSAGGFVSINPNPDSSMVAVHVLSDVTGGVTVGLETQESAEVNAITIIEVGGGVIDVVAGQIPVGSFWSPDGSKLLMLQIGEGNGMVDLRIWEGGNVSEVDSVELPQSMINQVLPFLDQYTQSLQLWSPDSAHFALPARRQGETGIWVYGVDGGVPVLVSDGQWVSWSPG